MPIIHAQLYDGDTIVVEPWRSRAFPIIKDLSTDRSVFDRIVQAGGYISVNTGSAPDANEILVARATQEDTMDAAACIACGACVAACKNASAMLFVGAQVSRFALLPQGQPERKERAERMVAQMDAEGFGACSFMGACSVECPASVPLGSHNPVESGVSRCKTNIEYRFLTTSGWHCPVSFQPICLPTTEGTVNEIIYNKLIGEPNKIAY